MKKLVMLGFIVVLYSCSSDVVEVQDQKKLSIQTRSDVEFISQEVKDEIKELTELQIEVFQIMRDLDFDLSKEFGETEFKDRTTKSIYINKIMSFGKRMNSFQVKNTEIDIQLILATALTDYVSGSSHDEVQALGTPCYDAMVVAVVVANVGLSAAAISSAGALVPVAYATYAIAMSAAAHNYCSCMNDNYGTGSC